MICTFQVKCTKDFQVCYFIYWSSNLGNGYASKWVKWLMVCEKSIPNLFLPFSLAVITTCAHHGELLGLTIFSANKRLISLSIKFLSSLLYLRRFVAVEWQSFDKWLNKVGGGVTFDTARLQIFPPKDKSAQKIT